MGCINIFDTLTSPSVGGMSSSIESVARRPFPFLNDSVDDLEVPFGIPDFCDFPSASDRCKSHVKARVRTAYVTR